LVMSSQLALPALPTVNVEVLDHREPVPDTHTSLWRLLLKPPIVARELTTLPPSLMMTRLKLPLTPLLKRFPCQREPLPVIIATLLLAFAATPIKLVPLTTTPPLLTTN